MKTFFSIKNITTDPQYVAIYAFKVVLQQDVLQTLHSHTGRQHMVISLVTSPFMLLTDRFFIWTEVLENA